MNSNPDPKQAALEAMFASMKATEEQPFTQSQVAEMVKGQKVFASILYSYYSCLCRARFSKAEALELTKGFQQTMLAFSYANLLGGQDGSDSS